MPHNSHSSDTDTAAPGLLCSEEVFLLLPLITLPTEGERILPLFLHINLLLQPWHLFCSAHRMGDSDKRVKYLREL